MVVRNSGFQRVNCVKASEDTWFLTLSPRPGDLPHLSETKVSVLMMRNKFPVFWQPQWVLKCGEDKAPEVRGLKSLTISLLLDHTRSFVTRDAGYARTRQGMGTWGLSSEHLWVGSNWDQWEACGLTLVSKKPTTTQAVWRFRFSYQNQNPEKPDQQSNQQWFQTDSTSVPIPFNFSDSSKLQGARTVAVWMFAIFWQISTRCRKHSSSLNTCFVPRLSFPLPTVVPWAVRRHTRTMINDCVSPVIPKAYPKLRASRYPSELYWGFPAVRVPYWGPTKGVKSFHNFKLRRHMIGWRLRSSPNVSKITETLQNMFVSLCFCFQVFRFCSQRCSDIASWQEKRQFKVSVGNNCYPGTSAPFLHRLCLLHSFTFLHCCARKISASRNQQESPAARGQGPSLLPYFTGTEATLAVCADHRCARSSQPIRTLRSSNHHTDFIPVSKRENDVNFQSWRNPVSQCNCLPIDTLAFHSTLFLFLHRSQVLEPLKDTLSEISTNDSFHPSFWPV